MQQAPMIAPQMHPDFQPDPLTDITPTVLVKAAGRIVLVAGGLMALMGLQSLGLRFAGVFVVVPYLQIVLGLAAAVMGWMLNRGRGWAAMAGAFCSVALAFFNIVWIVWALSNGYFTLMSLIVLPFAVVGSVLAALSVAPCKRADAARARLAADGLDLGL